jgi:hypothetical protein
MFRDFVTEVFSEESFNHGSAQNIAVITRESLSLSTLQC